jgi:alkylated DNA repair dioxygenase AlkB
VATTTETVQLDLFNGEEFAVDETFSAARRVWLDDTSWVEHVPGWLSGSSELLAQLQATAPWEHRERWMYTRMVAEPRLTAEYRVLAEAPQPQLPAIAAALSTHYGVPYDGLWLNLYRDHNDGTGWHADRPANRPPTAVVPVLSLGATRRFLIRPESGGPSTVFTPASGDLIVMGGRCQRDWRHCVPKQKSPAGPRSSLNFNSRRQA